MGANPETGTGVPLHGLSRIYALLVGLFAALLVASTAGGAKIVSLPGGLGASATVFSYAASFPITDPPVHHFLTTAIYSVAIRFVINQFL